MVAGAVRGTSDGPPATSDPRVSDPPGRFHSLDALRAAMMLLGLVLHAMASYVTVPLGDAWPFKDAHTTRAFELPLLSLIHI